MNQKEILEFIQQNPEVVAQAGQLVQQEKNTVTLDKPQDKSEPKSAPSISISELLAQPHIQSIISLYIKNSGKQFQWDIVLRYTLAFTAIGIAGFLGYYDKMDSTMGVLIGSVLGYMFGRKEG